MCVSVELWFQDVPRGGLASAASAVNRQHYTGCVDNGTTTIMST